MATTGNATTLFVSLALFGAAMVLINTGAGALQADLTPREPRGKVQGFSSFMNNIFMAIGAALGGFLYEYMTPQVPFFLAIVLILPSLIIVLALVHEPERREE